MGTFSSLLQVQAAQLVNGPINLNLQMLAIVSETALIDSVRRRISCNLSLLKLDTRCWPKLAESARLARDFCDGRLDPTPFITGCDLLAGDLPDIWNAAIRQPLVVLEAVHQLTRRSSYLPKVQSH